MGSPHKVKRKVEMSKCCGCSCKKCEKGHNMGGLYHTMECYQRLLNEAERVLTKDEEVN